MGEKAAAITAASAGQGSRKKIIQVKVEVEKRPELNVAIKQSEVLFFTSTCYFFYLNLFYTAVPCPEDCGGLKMARM